MKINSATAPHVATGLLRRARRRRAQLTLAIAVLLSSAAVGSVALPSPAAAAISYTTHVTPGNTAFLQLDVSGASVQPGAPVIDWYANGGSNQVWSFDSVGSSGNTYQVVNQNSGMCLTTDGVPGDQVYQWPCTGGANQQWLTSLNPYGAPGYYTIQSVSSGFYLDVNSDNPFAGTPIDTWYYNGNPNQKFAAD